VSLTPHFLSFFQDNDMMVAAGVGRASEVDGQLFFTPDGGREKVHLTTEHQDDKFYTASGPQVPRDEWSYTDAGSVQGNDGSPYTPQNGMEGEIYREGRSGMGDRAQEQATDPRWDEQNQALKSDYVCSEICKGFYGVFYPDNTTQKGQEQLAYRPAFPVGSDNPIHKNIWAVPYHAFEDATFNGFTKVNVNYINAVSTHTHNCTCSGPAAS
jgi:hypothetical protein